MAQTSLIEPAPVWRQWLAIGGGVLTAALWLMLFPPLAAEVLTEFPGWMQYAVFVTGLYLPLFAIALAAGAVGGIGVLRLGERAGVWLWAGLAVGFAGLTLSLAMSWLHGGVMLGAVHAIGSMVLVSVLLTLLQTGMEEVLCRGWMQPALIARIGTAAGIAVAAGLFTLFHLAGGAREPVSLLTILLAGVLFGLLALRSGGLIAPVAAHFAWNVLEDGGLGLVPNPGGAILGSLADIDLAGPVIWGGGSEGLNASVGTVVVLVALILPFLVPAKAAAEPAAEPAYAGRA